ncbi:LacI family transcriptional regulator [Pseudarthrobacter sp. W1I19]|uniref:LacI family DNA-binding transcriptional regulator n=1 Tax=Pseudarthrobacter sp. W1I19 TaxID=3042288 RepID=UPI0027822AA1|nr:LacI family DNA-binding transcriptional regulator [Pseudarthrobacter sp. W1I19]MDQ0922349.1 LacI family transcriptional regulator [Pseudarthrobacter sp. W1I19]
MATIVDVASLAGVSTSTVSHVLNETRHVEPETKERVISAVKATGYRRDVLARSMRRARTDSIGLVVSDAGEPAFADMVHGVEEAAAHNGLSLLLANSAEDPVRERAAVEALLDRRVDGLILARAAGSTAGLLERIRKEKKPLVLLDRLADLGGEQGQVDQVGVNNQAAMAALVDHLTSQGHERILLVSGDLRVSSLRERYDGFRAAMLTKGMAVPPELLCEGTVTAAATFDRVRPLLATPSGRPTAILACSTLLAAGALRAVQHEGLRVPGSMAFATFDGFTYSDLFQPQITTVRQPAFQLGESAVSLLLQRLENPAAPATILRLESRIEFRRSTSNSSTD